MVDNDVRPLISARQAEIAALVTSGKSNREIAALLVLSPRTVETHVLALFNKFGVHSRAELVAALLRPTRGGEFTIWQAAKTNLPLETKSLVGRQSELAEIAALLERERLVTITGAGGMGKTRTAVRVGANLSERWPDGVWVVELAPISDAALIPAAIAHVLGVQESPAQPLGKTLVMQLERRALLLILDNCEHVVEEAARIVGTILGACPLVRVLATSREPLRVAGEYTYRLPSLHVPGAAAARSLAAAQAAEYAAIALFTERAQAADRRFALTDENAPIVADICRRVDGIPLAIELAAGRVTILSVKALADNLDQRFRLLVGGDRTVLPRHQTMRALIDWSYDLLSAQEQRLFERLSVFSGGCTLASASAVAADDGTDGLAILDLLTSLVDKSLVATDFEGSEPRYHLLESARQYAREKLAARGEYADAARRHALAFLAWAEPIDRAFGAIADRTWTARAQRELDNCRAALEWALGARGDVALGQSLAGALSVVWSDFALPDGRRWVHTALQLVTECTPAGVAARLQYADASISMLLGERAVALTTARRALAGYRPLNDPLGTARVEEIIGRVLAINEMAEAESVLTDALQKAHALGNQRLIGNLLEDLAISRSRSGDLQAARTYFARAFTTFTALGAERAAANVGLNRAEAEFRAGDAEAAVRAVGDALSMMRSLNFGVGISWVLTNLAAYLVALGRYDEALGRAREGLELARDLRVDYVIAFTLQHIAAVAALRPTRGTGGTSTERSVAARLLGFVDARLTALATPREFTEQHEYDRMHAALAAEIGVEERDKLLAAGAELTVDQAIDESLEISCVPTPSIAW